VAVNRNKVFYFLIPLTHSLYFSARTAHLQVNIIVSCEASYCLLTDPLFRLSLHILSLIIKQILCLVSFVSSLVMYLMYPVCTLTIIAVHKLLNPNFTLKLFSWSVPGRLWKIHTFTRLD
jgi:hypothetical protein